MPWQRLPVWLFAPEFEDEERARLARVVHIIALAVLAGVVPPIAHNAITGRWLAVPALLVQAVCVVAVLALNRRGAVTGASRLLALSLVGTATALVSTAGDGTHDVAMLLYPSTLVVGALLLDRRGLVILTATVLVSVTAVMVAEKQGWIASPMSPYVSYRNLLDLASILVVTAVCVGLLAGDLRRSLLRARRQEARLGVANVELEQQAAGLRASEERFRSLVELAVDGILIGDSKARINVVNRRAEELTGYPAEELVGRRVETLFGEDELRELPLDDPPFGGDQVRITERSLRRRDGTMVPVEMSSKGMPDGGFQCFLRDVSDRQRAEAERARLEQELLQSQKMEAVGRLAGGIAHDFNNLLFAIGGCIDLSLRKVGSVPPVRRWLAEARGAVDRAGGLTRQLLAFSRKQVIEPQVFDLRTLVENVRQMLARVIGEDIELEVNASPELGLVRADPSHLEQILLNLAVNARDAMPEGGRLIIGLADEELDTRAGRGRAGLVPGPHVVLTVTDTGSGIPEGIRHEIFEPFFTTKPAGEGTGLGLSMVYGAIRQNEGTIEVDSQPGRGTTFRLFFPRASGDVARLDTPAEGEPRGGTETILLVEDEGVVRDVAAEQLASLGYTVVACETGRDALARLERPDEIGLLMTDVVMPELDGLELARRARQARPGLPVLFNSAYPRDVVARRGALDPGQGGFIAKPYTLAALSRKLRELLDS